MITDNNLNTHGMAPSAPSECAAASNARGGSILSFYQLREKVCSLNQQGIELFALKRYQSSLFYFNEAFRLVTVEGSKITEQDPRTWLRENDDDSCDDTASCCGTKSSSLFRQKPPIPPTFMRPLEILSHGQPESSSDVEMWILMCSMQLMFNGAVGHYSVEKYSNAEQLLLMAVALCEDEMDEEGDDEDDGECWCCRRRRYHLDFNLMMVHFMLGKVQACQGGPSHGGRLEETKLRECMESLTQSLTLSEELIGKGHVITASIYVSIGQVLLRQGYMQGASFAFRSADAIYNRPQAPIGQQHGETDEGSRRSSEAMTQLTDIEVSTMLLDNGWSFGAEMA